MEFCTIQSHDDGTVAALLHVYTQTTTEQLRKEYAGRYATEAQARAALEREFAEFITKFVTQDDRYIFALREEDGTIAAVLRIIHIAQDNWYLEALETAPECRRQGFARRLLTETLRCLRTLGARSVVSVVRSDNAASCAAHEACGFKDTGKTARDMAGNPIEDCVVYRYSYPE